MRKRSPKQNSTADSIGRLWETQRVQSTLHESLRSDVRELQEQNRRSIPFVLIGVGIMVFLILCGIGQCSKLQDDGYSESKKAEAEKEYLTGMKSRGWICTPAVTPTPSSTIYYWH